MKRKDNIVIGVLVITIVGLIIVNMKDTSIHKVPLKLTEIIEYNDNNIVAMNIQDSDNTSIYNESISMPDPTKYVINSSKSYCTKGIQGEKDTGIEMKTVNGNHVFNNLTKNARCFLYFDLAPLTVPDILAKYTKDNSRSGEIIANFTGNTPTTVYSKEDDYGTSYVFAGVNPNNWVKIGNIYFRIIRFNGNGSMRLIYSGTGSAETSGTETQIGSKQFNSGSDDNMYVGLQYTNGQVHGTGTNSTILGETNSLDATTLYGWYNNNIKNIYGTLIDSNVGFCNDREPSTDTTTLDGMGGTSTTRTFYGPWFRFSSASNWKTSFTPILKCKNESDNLKIPVGLITVDEYALAGGGAREAGYYSGNVWINTSSSYFTMSPYGFNVGRYWMFYIDSSGYLSLHNADNTNAALGVRPVINLKSTTIFENNNADGSAEKPYVVKI